MKHPPRRDRIEKYIPDWIDLLTKNDPYAKDFQLQSFEVVRNCQHKIAWVDGCVVVRGEPAADRAITATMKPIYDACKSLGIFISRERTLDDGSAAFRICNRYSFLVGDRNEVELKFDSALSVVAFINKVAAIFGYPPTPRLTREITEREVLVKNYYGSMEWTPEGEWLIKQAKHSLQEQKA
jgi:hypothetical protein